MKRAILLLLVCVPLLLVATATPAFGWAEPREPGAYVFLFSSSWFEVTPDGQEILHDWKPVDPDDPDTDYYPPDAIPADMDIWLYFRWVAPTKGLVQTVPLGMLVKLDMYSVVDIDADPWELGDLTYSVPTYADGATLWSRAYPWDGEPFEAFNPKVGARFWGIDWVAPVGQLDPGFYVVFTTQKFVHSVADLSGGYDLDQHTPMVFKRGVVESLAGLRVAEP